MIENLTFKQKVLYFCITIVIFGGIGIWLPVAIDYFPKETLSLNTKHSIVSNVQTFYLGLFFVASIDRLLYLIHDETYKHKTNEILISVLVFLLFGIFTYLVFQKMYSGYFKWALLYALLATIIAFAAWWRANHNPSAKPFGALGQKDAR